LTSTPYHRRRYAWLPPEAIYPIFTINNSPVSTVNEPVPVHPAFRVVVIVAPADTVMSHEAVYQLLVDVIGRKLAAELLPLTTVTDPAVPVMSYGTPVEVVAAALSLPVARSK